MRFRESNDIPIFDISDTETFVEDLPEAMGLRRDRVLLDGLAVPNHCFTFRRRQRQRACSSVG